MYVRASLIFGPWLELTLSGWGGGDLQLAGQAPLAFFDVFGPWLELTLPGWGGGDLQLAGQAPVAFFDVCVVTCV